MMRASVAGTWAVPLLLLATSGPSPASPFIRGDADGSGVLDVTDPIRTLGHLFLGEPASLECGDAADGDDSGLLDISDPIYLLNHLFLGGPAPPSPFSACGDDPTPDGLDCSGPSRCPGPDLAPPSFQGRGCTEIGCDPEIPLVAGGSLDLVSDDSCNTCAPLTVEDDRGIARLDLELLEGDPAAGAVAFGLSIPIAPPARLLVLNQDEARVLYTDPSALDPVFGRIPIPSHRLRLPASLPPGLYTRRIAASDGAGNRAAHDRPALVSVPEEGSFETVESPQARDPSPDATAEEVAELVRGNTEFLLDLYQAIREEGGNVFFSPYSISVALAMTWTGARGETERQMAETLRFRLPRERLHTAMNALDLELARRGEAVDPSRGEGFGLRVANSLWGQRGYGFLDSFLDALAIHYGTGLRALDFARAPEPARLAINAWVSDATGGKVLDLLPPGVITVLTRLVLTNAIYFKASWKSPFIPELTRDAPFHAPGRTVIVPAMRADADFGYARGEGWQAVELRYLGEETSMVVLLPDAGGPGGLEGFEASLDAARLGSILGSLETTRLLLSLPRFRFEFELPLKAVLTAMGMPDAFSETRADFSGIDGGRRLFIHAVLHKALIGVDEKGTEAAAATAVVIGPTSVPPEVIVDRPFLFLIRDLPTGAVLFLGRLVDPTG